MVFDIVKQLEDILEVVLYLLKQGILMLHLQMVHLMLHKY
jgi:hypothetical protein